MGSATTPISTGTGINLTRDKSISGSANIATDAVVDAKTLLQMQSNDSNDVSISHSPYSSRNK
jgi:hypothetical protein